MIKKIILLFLAILGLANCQKEIKITALTSVKQLPAASNAYKPVANIAYLAWWQQFQDPYLNGLMQQGLANNTDIHGAFGNLQQARGELLQIKLSWIPTVQTLAGYSTNPALGAPGAFYGVWPYYALNIMKLYTQGKQASYKVEYHEAALEGARLTVIGQIASAYFTLMSQQLQLRLLKQLNRDFKTLIKLNEQDLTIGLVDELILTQLRTDTATIAAQIQPVTHAIHASQNALRFLINENPGGIKNKSNFTKINFSQFKPGSLPATVLNNRPDMKMALYDLKATRAGEWVEWSNFFPALQLDELLGVIHLPHAQGATFTDAYADLNFVPNTFGKVASNKGLQYNKLALLNKNIKAILGEVDNAYSSNKRMNLQFTIYQQAETDYRHKYQLQEGLYQTGLLSYKELIVSKIYLDSLALRTNQAKLELALSLVVLYQALAGGYAHKTSQQECCLMAHK